MRERANHVEETELREELQEAGKKLPGGPFLVEVTTRRIKQMDETRRMSWKVVVRCETGMQTTADTHRVESLWRNEMQNAAKGVVGEWDVMHIKVKLPMSGDEKERVRAEEVERRRIEAEVEAERRSCKVEADDLIKRTPRPRTDASFYDYCARELRDNPTSVRICLFRDMFHDLSEEEGQEGGIG